MKTVGMYRRDFPRVSETFIGEQAQNLNRYEPVFILSKLLQKFLFKIFL